MAGQDPLQHDLAVGLRSEVPAALFDAGRGDRPVPLLAGQAGRVHDAVQRAEALDGAGERGTHRGLVGHVRGQREDLRAGRLEGSQAGHPQGGVAVIEVQGVPGVPRGQRVAGQQGEAGAGGAVQPAGDRAADLAEPAGDQVGAAGPQAGTGRCGPVRADRLEVGHPAPPGPHRGGHLRAPRRGQFPGEGVQ
ncbi:hypothetical protein GCM10020218_099010 [Dactylosporangium vinaceum]